MKRELTRKPKRIILINRDFQLRYANAAAIVGVVSTFFSCSLLLYPLYQFKILRIPLFLPLPILVCIGFAALMNILLVAMLGVYVTHRIAGPMYSLIRMIRRVERGSWFGQVRIRKGDDLGYLVRNFNLMLESVYNACQKDYTILEDALERLENKEKSLQQRTDEVQCLLAQLKDTYKQRLNITGEQQKNHD